MNFALDDRHRSMRRYLMAVLGSPPWTVRTERGEAVADEQRPLATVEVASPTVPGRAARVSVPQGNVEKAQTFALMLYPSFLDGSANRLSVPAARHEAFKWAEQLTQALTVGLVDEDDPAWNLPGERIPCFDYASVPVEGVSRAGPASPYGYMWVEDMPVRPVQDPDDPLRWTVVCDLRVSWEQGGRVVDPSIPLADPDAFGGAFVP